jgi:CrcB protein
VRTLVAIMVAGSLGAAARYGVDGMVSHFLPGPFPWGTLVVNVTASLLVGLAFAVTAERLSLEEPMRLALTTGFIGSYSTFSTLVLQSMRLLDTGAYGLAVVYTLGSIALGMVAVSAGILVGRAI